jgi:hypothetical protein
MSKTDYAEFVGSIVVDGVERELIARIYRPEFNRERSNYCCHLSAPHLCMEGDRVFGVDQQQAWELAVCWINMRAEGKEIRDRSGALIELIPFPASFPD